MNALRNLVAAAKDFGTKYPAVLSGYIIYSYLFITIMHYFLKVRDEGMMDFYGIFETFDAIPFMWLLAVAMVKVIEIRTKLHESETQRLLSLQEVQVKQAQLAAMQDVTKGLHVQLSTPVTAIASALPHLRRLPQGSPEFEKQLLIINDAAKRIDSATIEFVRS